MPDQNPDPTANPTPPVTDTPAFPPADIPSPVVETPAPLPRTGNADIPPAPPIIEQPGEAPPGSAAPSFDISTPGGEEPKKKFGGKRVIATILGLLVLVGGLGAGVILVRQQQDIREKAATSCTSMGGTCTAVQSCNTSTNNAVSGTDCKPAPKGPSVTCCVPKAYCSRQMNEDCIYGCEPTNTGGKCKPAPSPTATSCSSRGGTCQSAQSCTGNTISGPFSDCHPSQTMPNVVCCVPKTSPPPDKTLTCAQAGGQCYTAPNCTFAVGRPPVNGGSGCGNVSQVCCQPGGVVTSPAPADCPSGWRCDKISSEGTTCQETWPGSTTQPCKLTPSDNQNSGNCCIPPGGGTGTSTPAPSVTPRPGGGVTAQCLNIRAFDTSWNELSVAQLATLKAGDKVRFSVGGNASSGSFDKAKFKINGTDRAIVTTKRPASNDFYDEYTIPAGVTTFTIRAQIHHSSLGWSK